MSWSYNQIDVYFLVQDLPLGVGEVNLDDHSDPINNPVWIAASQYGILRGRITLTPSQLNNPTSVTIPGLNGVIYSSMASRTNAKLQFEILVENSWVHNEHDHGLVASRIDLLRSLIRDAKVFSYKMPGVEPNFYLKATKKAECTITDADRNCSLIQGQIEVVPFKYRFAGNVYHTVEPNNWYEHESHYPDGVAKPIIYFHSGGSGVVNLNISSDPVLGPAQYNQVECKNVPAGTILDTGKCLAYYDDIEGVRNPMNDHFVGDYTKLWIPRNRDCYFSSTNGINRYLVYTMEGVDL